MSIGTDRALGVAVLLAAAVVPGCRQDMHDQPRYEPLEHSTFFDDQTSARAPVAGTVAWGPAPELRDEALLGEDTLLFTGKSGPGRADYAVTFPFEITAALLDRGQERYDIFCSVCHDRVGAGNGMVPQRGFRRPPTFHDDRLRQAPAGYLFDVITNGFGVMPPYAQEIPPRDRWLIVAYVRALQLSQNARPADVPEAQRPLPQS